MQDLLLGFYGDDFTGSTDAMDALARNGIETVLFLSPPDKSDLNRLDEVQVVGIAGRSRSMNPTEMEDELGSAFNALSLMGAPLLHYKICSTFDSSPNIGSIGKAIDLGAKAFDTSTVPLLPGAPPLGRYVLFGNMFAEYNGDIYRLDRHPTMSDHPVTPMDESDLLRHLSKQTDREMDLIDVSQLRDAPIEAYREKQDEADITFFDALDRSDLTRAGKAIWKEHSEDMAATPEFIVGSSGVEYALASHWETEDFVSETSDFTELEPVYQTVVMSGSAS
ncbi:four-carbon acid sugar kinase family protein [Halocatena marina]|uniref:Four-carbon acid sugar kinase family protein n=2 Tax=Halocatena marina TaxID=2934937 RepID=A0ABD5YZR4_9EURY